MEEPVRHHMLHPPVDEGTHILPLPEAEADVDGVILLGQGRRLLVVGGDGPPRLVVDLQRPENPLLIGAVEPRGGGGVDLPQCLPEGLNPLLREPPLKLRPHCPAGVSGGEGPPGHNGVQIEAGAPH